MRRLLLLAFATILGGSSLLALYVAIDLDPDVTTPSVESPSYNALFEAAVRQRTGRTWDRLDEPRRLKTLGDLIASREADPVREVALFRTRTLENRKGALALLRRHLMSLGQDHFEVAVASVLALDLPVGRRYLDSLRRILDASPAAHTPLGGYRTASLLLTEEDDGLGMRAVERSRRDADYSRATAPEIALLFPTGPDYFIEAPNADDVLDRFDDSRFVGALEGTPVPEDAWSLPLLRTLRGLRNRLSGNIGLLGRFFAPEELLQDHLLVARYDDDYLLVTYKDKNVSLAEGIISVFEALGRDFGIKRWRVGPTTASAILNRRIGSAMAFATVDDYLVVATDTALMSRSLRTFHSDRARSIAIEPLFNREITQLDQTGKVQLLFAWFNPSRHFDVTGAERPDAARLAILSAALGSPLTVREPYGGLAARVRDIPGIVAATAMTGDSTSQLWRYIVSVRSVGRSAVDSLARIAGIDVAKSVAPVLGRTWALGYGGLEYLARPYGYSHTGFSLIAAVPLQSPPSGFDTTLRRFLAGISFLEYRRDSLSTPGIVSWIAHDTTSNDTVLLARRLQPSFAVVDDRLLVLASTPALLGRAAAHMRSSVASAPTPAYFSGAVRIDSFATNAARYLRAFLLRGDRYSPDEIQARIEPLRRAVSIYSSLDWEFTEQNGVRSGWARIH